MVCYAHTQSPSSIPDATARGLCRRRLVNNNNVGGSGEVIGGVCRVVGLMPACSPNELNEWCKY